MTEHQLDTPGRASPLNRGSRHLEGAPDGFGGTAVKLARNPLGIIALFIVLVYAIAGTVVSVGRYDEIDSRIGMLFIFIFPFVVLLVFFRLVTRHHMKLYDPSQVQSNEKFIDAYVGIERFSAALSPEIVRENEAAILTLQRAGLPGANNPQMKAALYIGEWTSRRMAEDRAIFRQIRKQGLEGFREAASNPQQYDALTRVFDFIEELCGDINKDFVDDQVIYDSMWPSLRRAWERSADFILLVRQGSATSNFMNNLQTVYARFKSKAASAAGGRS